MDPQNVIIIGAGLSGVTTGILLQLFGVSTQIVYQKKVTEGALDAASLSRSELDPRYASLYAAGSVIPHSVRLAEDAPPYLENSLYFFRTLAASATTGVRMQRHYELSEEPVSTPAYAKSLSDLQIFEKSDPRTLPRRQSTESIWGWSFDCFFAELPEYISILYRIYQELGGSFCERTLDSRTVRELPTEILVNCAGFHSWSLFDDPSPRIIIRGHLVYVEHPALRLAFENRGMFSYNYKPLTGVYPVRGEGVGDVYCYPRSDVIIFGGSRECGAVDEDGIWRGKESPGELIEIDGVRVPRPIVDVNSDILRTLFNLSEIHRAKFKAVIGYRSAREDGLRVSREIVASQCVIHNYGHGGSGLTLSWGTALEVLRMLKKVHPIHLEQDEHFQGRHRVIARSLKRVAAEVLNV